MKVVKLALIAIAVVAVFIVADQLLKLNRPDSLTTERIDLMKIHRDEIANRCEIFLSGWSDTEYSNISGYIEINRAGANGQSSFSDEEYAELLDCLGATAQTKLATFITKQYKVCPERPFDSNAALKRAYQGVDFLAKKHPVLKTGSVYKELIKDRTLYKKIHSFISSSYELPAQFNAKTVMQDNDTLLSIRVVRDYADFNSHYSNIRARQGGLELELKNSRNLGNIAWMNRGLSDEVVAEKLTVAEKKYRVDEAERTVDILTEIVENINDSCDLDAMITQLTQINTGYNSAMYGNNSAYLDSKIRELKNYLRRVKNGAIKACDD